MTCEPMHSAQAQSSKVKESRNKCFFGLVGHHCREIKRNGAKCVAQRGPTAFDLQAILEKHNNLRATSTKRCIKQQGSQDLKLKKKVSECVIESITQKQIAT